MYLNNSEVNSIILLLLIGQLENAFLKKKFYDEIYSF